VVQDLLGPSLSDVRREMPERHYSSNTVLRLALFMLDCICAFHSHGFVHRDIKPGNFLLRSGGTNPLALIDFGLSKRYREPQTGRLYPEREKCGFRGTVRYASLETHRGRDQCPRDDIVSWLYSVVELADGRLPWTPDRDSVVIQRKKLLVSNRLLLHSLPPEFIEIANYVATLGYASEVRYDFITCLICRPLNKLPFEPFDWEALPAETIEALSPVTSLPLAVDYAGCIPNLEIANSGESSEEMCAFCEVA
jgi:serine/threonine protein kinase